MVLGINFWRLNSTTSTDLENTNKPLPQYFESVKNTSEEQKKNELQNYYECYSNFLSEYVIKANNLPDKEKKEIMFKIAEIEQILKKLNDYSIIRNVTCENPKCHYHVDTLNTMLKNVQLKLIWCMTNLDFKEEFNIEVIVQFIIFSNNIDLKGIADILESKVNDESDFILGKIAAEKKLNNQLTIDDLNLKAIINDLEIYSKTKEAVAKNIGMKELKEELQAGMEAGQLETKGLSLSEKQEKYHEILYKKQLTVKINYFTM